MLPSDGELPALIANLQSQLEETETRLSPHRADNSAPPTEEEVATIESDWARWREEWKKRKGMFKGSVKPSACKDFANCFVLYPLLVSRV